MKASQILEELEMRQGTARKSEILAIYRAADDGGTIQAEEMVALFPGMPSRHTTTSIAQALIWAGCCANDNGEWRGR